MAVADPWILEAAKRSATLSPPRLGRRLGSGKFIFVSLGVVSLVVLLLPLLAPYSPTDPVGASLLPPLSHGHLLGTDDIGRDLLSRILYGIRSSWFGTIAVLASALVIGTVIGVIAGLAGGVLDAALMRFSEIFLAMPAQVLAICLVAALGPSYVHVLIAVAVVWWPAYARIIRTGVRSVKVRPHVEAARLADINAARLAARHILPGVLGPPLVLASVDIGTVLLVLSGLSLIGLGAPAPAPELGAMVSEGFPFLLQAWWVPLLPGFAITIIVLIGMVLGDIMRGRISA
jgi:peptide/nickel transport system permease protein